MKDLEFVFVVLKPTVNKIFQHPHLDTLEPKKTVLYYFFVSFAKKALYMFSSTQHYFHFILFLEMYAEYSGKVCVQLCLFSLRISDNGVKVTAGRSFETNKSCFS